jgi:oligopeptide/dipeptide ABC transporter ATP-binding protein
MLLAVQNLTVEFQTNDGTALRAVEDVSFALDPGVALGIVGESGCGKTTTMLALLRLLPVNGRIVSGSVFFKGVDLLALDERALRRYRWRDLAIVFQGAMNALNPVRSVGDQIREAILVHESAHDRARAKRRVGELLELVGIPAWRATQFPHQYSGGMRQRALIAMALACDPALLIADEPTTALDVMVQAQIMDLLDRLRRDLNLALIVVTHDLGVVAEYCQQALVMYGGRVAEYGEVAAVFGMPRHPYTQRLLAAFPTIDAPRASLVGIPGIPPQLSDLPSGCRFHPRCAVAVERCARETPVLRVLDGGQAVACHLAETDTRPGDTVTR